MPIPPPTLHAVGVQQEEEYFVYGRTYVFALCVGGEHIGSPLQSQSQIIIHNSAVCILLHTYGVQRGENWHFLPILNAYGINVI
ncbi:MAG: hypothetical protein LBS50_06740 [Prevotellaceae bacterium]|jgi:hypothetical protein|nr:hypothetical protein [Prevotellaceae bacterium]